MVHDADAVRKTKNNANYAVDNAAHKTKIIPQYVQVNNAVYKKKDSG